MLFAIIPDKETINNALEDFSGVFLKNILYSYPWSIEEINTYNQCVNELLNYKVKEKTEKPSFPIPFCGIIVDDWCKGIKKNHRLYTQCVKHVSEEDGRYCKFCKKQAENNASNVPNCGDIADRKEKWDDNLNFKPDGMMKEIPYANLIDKLNVTWGSVQAELNKLEWGEIPSCHKLVKKSKRGRPKTVVAVSDSDEDVPKKKRGRPRKPKKTEMTDDELIAALCGE